MDSDEHGFAAPGGAYDQRLVTSSPTFKNMSKNGTFNTFYKAHFITVAVKVIVSHYRYFLNT